MKAQQSEQTSPTVSVHVAEPRGRRRKGWELCEIVKNIEFQTNRLETYCIANWEPVIYDALLVAAAAEFADRTLRRSALSWQRNIELNVPVHDVARWSNNAVADALHDALNLLTGDRWQITFYSRNKALEPPRQAKFNIPPDTTAVIPFSNGLDSRCVAGLLGRRLGDRLICVRLGSKASRAKALSRERYPFTSVPYKVHEGERRFVEATARSRGFKFAMLSGLAAYLSGASQIIVPESGQGALGPSLVTVGQAYEDYRSHPLFSQRMEKFLHALFQRPIRFSFPRLWFTKAETLLDFIKECGGDSWVATWSCWQQTRQVSVDQKKRQCGICAACMLRRMSIHAAGLKDVQARYVWENLKASDFRSGAAASFPKTKITRAQREYAIAGTLHLDHLAALHDSPANAALNLQAFQLSRVLGDPETDVRAKLDRLIAQHETEWRNFVHSLGRNSFVADWAVKGRS